MNAPASRSVTRTKYGWTVWVTVGDLRYADSTWQGEALARRAAASLPLDSLEVTRLTQREVTQREHEQALLLAVATGRARALAIPLHKHAMRRRAAAGEAVDCECALPLAR